MYMYMIFVATLIHGTCLSYRRVVIVTDSLNWAAVVFYSEASKTVSAAIKKIAVAMENGEYDFDGTKEKQVYNE